MAKLFPFYMVTPDGKSYRGECDLLSVNSTDGILGILANHAPLEAILDIGQTVAHIGNKEEVFAVSGGILHITKEGVTILADSFEAKDEIDLSRAENSKSRAESRLKSKGENIDVKRAEVALRKAINRIKVASK